MQTLSFDYMFDPHCKSKLFEVKPVKVKYSVDVDVDLKREDGKKLAQTMLLMWKKDVVNFHKEREKVYNEAIAATEKNIKRTAAKKKDLKPKEVEKWLEAEAKTANTMIKKANQAFVQSAQARSQKVFDKVAEAVDKKYKSTFRHQKFNAAVNFVRDVAIGLLTIHKLIKEEEKKKFFKEVLDVKV